jgi:methionine--tRNA ligase beta chain
METKEKIDLIDFLEAKDKLDIRIGQVISAERIPKSKKMLKLQVIFGEEDDEELTVVTNIGDKFEPDDLLAVTFPFIVNLTPAKVMGITSEAMIVVNQIGDEIYLDNRIGASIL